MKLIHYILLFFFGTTYFLAAAENYVSTGMNKLSNTYNFSANSIYSTPLFYGRLDLQERYQGTALKDLSDDFRDLNDWSFKYSIEIDSNFVFFLRNNWYYSNDRQADGVNKLERQSLSPGLLYNFDDMGFLELSAGKEKNIKIGIVESGTLVNSKGAFANSTEGYNYLANMDMEYLSLDDGRKNSSIAVNGKVSKEFDNNDNMGMRLNYNRKDFDNFAGVSTNLFDKTIFKNRMENRLSTNFDISYSILDNWNLNSVIDYNSVNVTEEYNKFTNDLKYSGIKRDLEEQYLKIDFNTSIKSINSFFKFGYRVSYRDEKNQTQNKYSINEIDYQQLRNLDKQKDNITNITGLYSEIMHSFSVNDTIYFDSYVSILRYDTPDEQNYSDRDELSYSVSGRYKHRFSENLSASVLFATNYLHLVYLKSQNSGSNNVNRIFRLNPKVEITFANFSMRPSFEVLANYTVYDYETANRGPESYSFRQIAYNDTIIIKADKKRSIELQNNLRYYETGKLFWDEFLESPETGNYEQFTKLMLYTTASPIVRLGIGARYHFLEQHHIFQQPGNPSSAIYSGKSIAPETEISVKFSSNSEISLQGWYEFQYIKGLEKKEIPNLFLTTKIVL